MATTQQEESAEVLPQTRRPDGSLRPAVRVKKGYVPPEEEQKYDRWKSEPQTGPPGAGGADDQAAQKAASKTALKNQKRKEKKKQEAEAAPRTSQKSHTSSGQAEEQRADADGATPADANGDGGAEAASDKAAADLSAVADAAMGEVEKKLKALKKRLRQVQVRGGPRTHAPIAHATCRVLLLPDRIACAPEFSVSAWARTSTPCVHVLAGLGRQEGGRGDAERRPREQGGVEAGARGGDRTVGGPWRHRHRQEDQGTQEEDAAGAPPPMHARERHSSSGGGWGVAHVALSSFLLSVGCHPNAYCIFSRGETRRCSVLSRCTSAAFRGSFTFAVSVPPDSFLLPLFLPMFASDKQPHTLDFHTLAPFNARVQIQELEERQRGGEVLNADQLGKLEHKTEVVSELQLLEDMFSKM
eukprot:6177248-Pleurochrysis_carterae.AAC.1